MSMTESIAERVRASIAKHPGMSNSDITKRINMPDGARLTAGYIESVRSGMKGGDVAGDAKKKAKSLSDFKKLYDKDTIVPAKIKAALKELGKDGWNYESDFVKDAGVSLNDLGNYRDMFSDYIVSLKRDSKRVWAGSKEMATEMRGML